MSESESHLGDDRDKLAGWEMELEAIAPEMEMLQALEETSAEALLQAEEDMHNWQHQWDEFNQHAAEPRQQAEVQQSRIQHVEQVLQRVQKRTRQLEQEKEGLQDGPAEGEIEALGEQVAEIELTMAEHEDRGEGLVETLSSTRDNVPRCRPSSTRCAPSCSRCAGARRHWKRCSKRRWKTVTRP